MNRPAATPVGKRLVAHLPAVFLEADGSGGGDELQSLLAAFEEVLLGLPDTPSAEGFEQLIAALPDLIGPRGASGSAGLPYLPAQDGEGSAFQELTAFTLPGDTDPEVEEAPRTDSAHPAHAAVVPPFDTATRDAFMPWLAARWVSFAPFAHFEPARLRRIVAGIVPLYARRGTPAYLKALLRLCFEEIADIDLQEHLSGGLRVGQARIGTTTQLGAVRPFTFGLGITLRPRAEGWHEAALAPLGASLRAVIDFAKPAHTCCELHLAALDTGPVHVCG